MKIHCIFGLRFRDFFLKLVLLQGQGPNPMNISAAGPDYGFQPVMGPAKYNFLPEKLSKRIGQQKSGSVMTLTSTSIPSRLNRTPIYIFTSTSPISGHLYLSAVVQNSTRSMRTTLPHRKLIPPSPSSS